MTVKFSDINPKPADLMFKFGVASITPRIGEEARRFSGVAYTGNPIVNHPYWGTVVFDLSLMCVPERMPILRDHYPEKIVGHSDEFAVTADGLVLGGVLSKVTEHGREVAALSDENFPWQMSVRITPLRIEEVLAGGNAVVNGREVKGPAYIFRESELSETSFTPIGWDSGTSATALSLTATTPSQEDPMDLKELEEMVKKLEGELKASKENEAKLTGELAEIKASAEKKASEVRLSKIEAAYKAVGKELTEDERKSFANVSDEAVAVICSMADTVKNSLPPTLFNHVAQKGPKLNDDQPKGLGDQLVKLCEKQAEEFAKK
jgi:hypothetical protein